MSTDTEMVSDTEKIGSIGAEIIIAATIRQPIPGVYGSLFAQPDTQNFTFWQMARGVM
ncbi:hypothetical protein [Acidithiobacillus ferrivorans]|uniref:Uncharacterized protein n=1 Tax=Acidithiobacillus ferrivorans TaxID=160808 RepID=A0A7T5BI38_9PROT|nr:hypothetical protein [Acidithiobacillus ferrivorans]QQD72873.1 hypothetical protein H2515_00555 [Acidithiobacillus ferrivorans]